MVNARIIRDQYTKSLKTMNNSPVIYPGVLDLISTLEKAIANREYHEEAQTRFYSDREKEKCESAPLYHCNTSCCIAGDIALRNALAAGECHSTHYRDVEVEVEKYLDSLGFDGPWSYAKDFCGLATGEAILLFDGNTHWKIHQTMVEIFKRGGSLPVDLDVIGLRGSYMEFIGATLQNPNVSGPHDYTSVDDLCNYLMEIAEYD